MELSNILMYMAFAVVLFGVIVYINILTKSQSKRVYPDPIKDRLKEIDEQTKSFLSNKQMEQEDLKELRQRIKRYREDEIEILRIIEKHNLNIDLNRLSLYDIDDDGD